MLADTARLHPPANALNLRQSWSKTMWIIFLGLTSLILVYPLNLRLEYFPVESIHIFTNLPLFVIFFYLWMVSLLVLLLAPAAEGAAVWQRLVMVVIAALIFYGFWTLIAPFPHQGLEYAGAANQWKSSGHMLWNPSFSYYPWPANFLLTDVLSDVTGQEILPSVTVQGVFLIIVTIIAAYVFLLSVLKSSLAASLACLLALVGGQGTVVTYAPAILSNPFVFLLLGELCRKGGLESSSRILVAILLMSGVTVTYLFSTAVTIIALLAIWAFAVLLRPQDERPTTNTLILFLVIPLAWLIYWARGTGFERPFGTLVTSLKGFTGDLLGRFGTGVALGARAFQEGVPLWINGTRIFWMSMLYGGGGLLWLWYLTRYSRLGAVERRLVAVFSGLALLSIAIGLFGKGGFADLYRPLVFVSFIAGSFLLLFVYQFKPIIKKAAVLALAVMLVALSFPGFVGGHFGIAGRVWYPTELAGGKWLQSLYGTGHGLNIFATSYAAFPSFFYLSDANYTRERIPEDYADVEWGGVFQSMDELLDRFARSSQLGDSGLFIDSPKFAHSTAHLQDVLPHNPRWAAISARLAEHYNEIYNNGPIQMYSNEVTKGQ